MPPETLVLPPRVAKSALPFVVNSIKVAHELAPAKWGVTPRSNGLRLNLGFIEVLTVDANEVRVVVHADSVPLGFEATRGYSSTPGSRIVSVPVSRAKSVLPRLRATHERLLEVASTKGFNRGSKAGHKDWIVDEIARITGDHLPLPTHENSEGRLVPQSPDEVARTDEYSEGSVTRVLVNVYERDPGARERCIEHYGRACFVCGMKFGEVYGREMDGIIHVHHLAPLHANGRAHTVDPIKDLRPICPNCHTVAHQTTPPRTMDAMKALLTGAVAAEPA